MSNEMNDSFAQVEQIVVAGASALREALGVPVTARDVQEVSDPESDTPADGVVVKATTAAGSLAVAGGSTELEAAGDADAIMTGLAEQIAQAAGSDSVESVVMDSISHADLAAPVSASFELTVDGNAVPVVISVEAAVFVAAVAAAATDEADDAPTVARAPLPDLNGSNGNGAGGKDSSVLSDVSMKVTVQLGHTELLVRDLLSLGEGSVVELDQAPGTPVDILVNGTAVARGDVVVVHDDLGVRITEVLGSPE